GAGIRRYSSLSRRTAGVRFGTAAAAQMGSEPVPPMLTDPVYPTELLQHSSTELPERVAHCIRALDGYLPLLQRLRDGAARRRQLRGRAPVEAPRPRRGDGFRASEERAGPLEARRDRRRQRRGADRRGELAARRWWGRRRGDDRGDRRRRAGAA